MVASVVSAAAVRGEHAVDLANRVLAYRVTPDWVAQPSQSLSAYSAMARGDSVFRLGVDT